MTNADRLLQFLQEHKNNCYCDDCLSRLVGVFPRQQVNRICGNKWDLFKRHNGEKCSNCGKGKNHKKRGVEG